MDKEEDHDCPICATIPPGKIFQCMEGHIVCESCLRKIQENATNAKRLPTCPSCAGSLNDGAVSRCRALENMMDRLTIDCCHASVGCQVKLNRNEVIGHGTSCLYGKGVSVCGLFGNPGCEFRLSVATAKDIWQHVRCNHPNIQFVDSHFLIAGNFRDRWRYVVDKGVKYSVYCCIPRVPHSTKYIALINQISNGSISFYCVDFSLSLSKSDNWRVTLSIPNVTYPLLTCSFVAFGGIDSWEYLKDENRTKPLKMDIQSLLQHSDIDGVLEMMVQLTSK